VAMPDRMALSFRFPNPNTSCDTALAGSVDDFGLANPFGQVRDRVKSGRQSSHGDGRSMHCERLDEGITLGRVQLAHPAQVPIKAS